MLAFFDNTIAEFKEFIKSWKILVWVILTTLLLLVSNNGITNNKETYKIIPLFKEIQKKYFDKTSNYALYGKDGIEVL